MNLKLHLYQRDNRNFGLVLFFYFSIKFQLFLYFSKKLLRKKCSYSDLFWSAFSRIRIKYGEIYFLEILLISLYSVRLWENADQNNSECGHFPRSVGFGEGRRSILEKVYCLPEEYSETC